MSYFIGIDSSTTATKALLMDEAGKIVAVASSEYDYETPKPLWSEQHPELWWNGTVESIREVLQTGNVSGEEVKGIGLTGQMHGMVLLDKAGEVLRPAILWNDQRTAAECDEIRDRIGKERLIQICGNDALTGFTAPKILWVKNHEPDIYAKIAQILLPKDYVRFRLTGEYAADRAGGSGTILFDLAKRTWSDELIKKLEIDPAWLREEFPGVARHVMVFRRGGFLARREKWFLNGAQLEIVNSFRYLGYTFTTKLLETVALDNVATKAKQKSISLLKIT